MNLQRLTQIELNIAMLNNRLGPVLTDDHRTALLSACDIVHEVRHFAVAFMDVSTATAAGQMDADRALQHREEAVSRMVQVFRPD